MCTFADGHMGELVYTISDVVTYIKYTPLMVKIAIANQ